MSRNLETTTTPRRILLLCLVSISICGCLHSRRPSTGSWPECHSYNRRVDDCLTAKQAQHRARSALRDCDGDYSRDYEAGFVQAWVDVALGGSGELPPIPPEHYWKVRRRDPEGHNQAHQWFMGYAAGARCALGRPDHPYNDIPATGPIQASYCPAPAYRY